MKPLVQKGLLLMALLSFELLSCLAQSSMLKGRIYSAESFNNINLQSGKVANMDIAMNSSEEETGIIRTSEQEKNDTGLLDILGGIFRTQLTGGF
ncbi:MAG: hypothetical protein U5L96_12830 [Owenweeksia sp.]|nr:hypothetical protein [Owenweeksia sp.]